MRNILLIDTGIKKKPFADNNRFINRGLLSIATFLKSNCYNIKYVSLDQFYLNRIYDLDHIINKISEIIIKKKINLIGISTILIPEGETALFLINKFKDKFKNLPIVGGGYFFKYQYGFDNILKSNGIDYIITGEGEWSFFDLLQAIDLNNNLRNVEGLVYNHNGQIRENQYKGLKNLSNLPPLDYSILDRDYLLGDFPLKINLGFARGCYFNCSFCSVSIFWNNIRREHDYNNILEELKQLNQLSFKGKISIEDCTVNLKSLKMKKFLRSAIKLNKTYTFDYITTRYDFIDDESLKLINELGFDFVFFGLETGSNKIMKYIGKPISKLKFELVCKKVIENNIGVNIFIIIGLPGETQATFNETYSYLKFLVDKKLVDNIFITHFQPYKDIKSMKKFYEIGGKILAEPNAFSIWIYKGKPLVEYKHLSQKKLQEMFDKINKLNKFKGTEFRKMF